MFQIIEDRPTYCGITDGITGSSFRRLPMTYKNEALAHKLAAVFTRRDYENCGDSLFRVVRAGDSVLNYINTPARAASYDEVPF